MNKQILIILGLVLLGFAIYNLGNKREDVTANNTVMASFSEMHKQIADSKSEVIIESNLEYAGVWWIDSDGYSILLPATETIGILKPSDYLGELNKVMPFFEKELEQSRQIIKSKGLILNKANSSTSTSDVSFYDYVEAYEKGDEKCTIEINPDNIGFGDSDKMSYRMDITCGKDFTKYQTEQKPFLEALNLKDKDAVFVKRKEYKDFVVGSIDFRRTGYMAILKKESGKFREIYSGQDSPMCDLVERENIPVELAPTFGDGCYITPTQFKVLPVS